ncbi:PAS domain-containing sensor histidine kinase [Fictibacillus sp. S7]|uniref:PAS domain-containing sensor histidine kinase n=1 Tax=Fictibacillus sp. S7 TaxID=2212476 RepID=UPI0013E9933B|nr:PAS domain S-box protein [Fictibacillus sp. S7]
MENKLIQSPMPFIDQLSDAVLVLTRDYLIQEMNVAAQQLTGKSKTEMEGLPISKLLPDFNRQLQEQRVVIPENLQQVVVKLDELGMDSDYLVCILKPCMQDDDLETQCDPQKDLLVSLTHVVPDFIGIKDGKGKFVYANKFAGELFGYSHVEFIGKTDADLGRLIPCFKPVFDNCIQTDETVWQERKLKRCLEKIRMPSGDRVFDVYKIPMFTEEGKRKNLLVFGREITDQVSSHEKLLESESRYRLLAENSTDMISTHTIDGNMQYVSPACEQLLGYTPQELLKKKAFALFHPDDIRRSLEAHKQLLDGKEIGNYQLRLKHKNGEFRWVEAACRGIKDEKTGEVIEIIAVTRDISERLAAEELLRNSDKLSIVGQLAASVAHEIRNPLTALKGFIQLFQSKGIVDCDKYYRIMLDELNRIEQIITELLILAKPQSKTVENKDIKELIHYVVALLDRQALIHNVHIVCELEERMSLVQCVENELKQVFINLVKNAIEAMPDGGIIHIDCVQKGAEIEVTIQDQGCGIPPESLEKLGEPFYSTKEKGTGLGLMTSFKIIQEHQGKIDIQSHSGKGTIVRIILPAA